MIGPDVTYRSTEAEIMDDFFIEGNELHGALDQIASINKLLGGNKITLDGVKQLLKHHDKEVSVTLVDVGCGNGDMLRMLADFAMANGFTFSLIGVDANSNTIAYAKQLSATYNIKYQCLDVFKSGFENLKYDIALCTLTLHHFSNEEIKGLLQTFKENAEIGVVVNDLHRSKLAYGLFKVVGVVLGLNKMARYDGAVSILRGFRKKEIIELAEKLGIIKHSIRWRWAFRYQWIIEKT
ncbi:MAG: methyltransferase domain-containing protein [Flavobacterium sp.]